MARQKTEPRTIDARQFALECARIANENKAEDVVVLDLRGRSSICDYFLICTGTADRQMRTIADYIDECAARSGQGRFNISGYDQSSWILIDYVDVVVHIFNPDSRKYYDLELLWGDAPRVELPS
jgi:ribosome-associated protein